MTSTSEHAGPSPRSAPHGARGHPGWCDPARCGAGPVGQSGGWPAGEHRSTGIVLEFTTACLLPVRDGTAWLSRSSAPWPCATWLRIRAGGLDLALPADTARQVLGTLSPLLALAAAAGEECP